MTELEGMFVRIGGDGSEYQRMLQQAQTNTLQAAQQVERAGGRIEAITNSLRGFAQGALSALASLGTTNWLRTAFGEWGEAERTAFRLEAAIEANGRAVEPLIGQYRQFASEMQNVTTTGDDTTLALIAQAESFNLTGDAAQEAVRAAMAFASINDGNAASYLRFTAAMQRGDVETAMSMARMIPQLRGITDQTQFLARASQLVATGWRVTQAEARSATGQIAQLKNAYGDLMEEFGKVVADGIKPFVDGMKTAVLWIQSLPDWMKKAITWTAILASGFLAIATAIGVAAFIFNAGFGGIGIIMGGIITGTVALIAWASQLEIVGEMWGWVKQKSLDFWLWFRPVVRAGIGYMSALWEGVKIIAVLAWDAIKSAAVTAWTFIRAAWNGAMSLFSGIWGIVGLGSITFEDIKNFAIEAFIGAEFAVRNFGRVAEWAWTGVQLGIEIVKGHFTHFFGVAMPTYLRWLQSEWGNVWDTAFSLIGTGFRNLFGNMARLRENIPRLLAGTISLADIWQPLTDGMRNTIGELPQVARREMSRVEQDLRAQFTRQGGQLLEDWAAFRQRRLAEINAGDSPLAQQGRDAGRAFGQQFTQAARQEIQGFDQVFRFSAEAQARIRAQFDRIRGNPLDRQQQGRASTPQIAVNVPASNQQGPNESIRLLTRIAVAVERLPRPGSI